MIRSKQKLPTRQMHQHLPDGQLFISFYIVLLENRLTGHAKLLYL